MVDVVIIGGGLNGLVAANVLAKKKYSVLVLERHDRVGGAAVTTATRSGAHAATLSHAIGPISADVTRALGLDRAGLSFITPDPVLTTLGPNNSAITFHRDHVLTAASIGRLSQADAGAWQPFVLTLQRLAAVLADINRSPAPSIDAPATGDLWRLMKVGRRARALGRKDLARLARYAPMAVADLLAEWFEHDLVQSAVAARALLGHCAGPWSAGTGLLLLQRMADDPMPVGGGVTVKGGPGALTAALASMALASGVTIRTEAHVDRILTRDNTAVGVVLTSGEEIPAHTVVGAVDPKQLFLSLVNAADLPPTFRQRVRQIRARGVTAKINLTLSGLPVFPGLAEDELLLRGRLLIGPSIDYLERAYDAVKYGGMSPDPWLELSLPSANDETLTTEGRHVLSIYMHHVPHDAALTGDEVLARALKVLAPHAPSLVSQIVEKEVLTPVDLEQRWGYTGGHIFHGEGSLDQWWVSRPVLGWAHHHGSPIAGLFLAGAGAHPGGGLTGQAGLNAARVIASTLRRHKAR